MSNLKGSNKHKKCNHHHEITSEQKLVDFGSGEFVADRKRIALLKALNECGLVTRTHCYGHKTGYSFISILLENNLRIEVRKVNEVDADRTEFNGKTELLLSWERTD